MIIGWGRALEPAWIGLWRSVALACVMAGIQVWTGHAADKSAVECKSWGNLTVEAMILEAPDEYLSNHRARAEELDWFVPKAALTNFLERAKFFDLTPDQSTAIRDANRWRTSTNGCRFRIDPKLISGLSQLGRGQIYLFLSEFPENLYQHTPFILSQLDLDACLAKSGLKTETVNLLKPLFYKRGPSWCFSDMSVFADLPPDEFKRLLKMLSRVSSVALKLHVNEDSDINALINYWGKRGTERHTRTLLESLAKVPGGATLDIIHLLPPLARERLYKYPDRSDPTVAQQQCFWTALNFFNERPDDRFAKGKVIQEVLRKDYFRLSGEPSFGDLVVLADSADQIFHCSVYIADDVVFTKNGGDLLKPWMLMKLPDMVATYGTTGPLRVVTLRFKENLSQPAAGL